MARANLQIKVGTYTGNGADSTNITGIGFRPDFILIKGGANHTIFRTKRMIGDVTGYVSNNAVNLANAVQEILNDGFQVGTNAVANTNTTPYFYIAIKGTSAQKYFNVGKYFGSGADNRDFNVGGVSFTPDFVFTKADAAQHSAGRSSAQTGDATFHFTNVADASNKIQSLISNGFQLGSHDMVNKASTDYYYMAMKHFTGAFVTGTYTGNGLDNRVVTGLGFQPDAVIVKNGTSTQHPVMITKDMTAGESFPLNAAAAVTTGIKSLDSDGFTVGTGATANESGSTHWYVAFKSGDYNTPLSRTIL